MHLDVGMVLGRLGMAHYEAKQYEQSAARFREALAILRLHLPREDLNVTLVVNELARALDEAGHHDEAAKHNEENLKVREASLGRKNPATLLSVHNLGMNYVKLHRWAEAIPLLERWLEESEPARLAKNPTLPITLEYLGDSHQAVGHHDKAEKYYNQVLAIVEAQPKKDFSHEVLILEKLVQLTSLQGPAGFDKAQKYGQRCVKTAQEHLGPEHLETAKALGVVALPTIVWENMRRRRRWRASTWASPGRSTATILFSRQGSLLAWCTWTCRSGKSLRPRNSASRCWSRSRRSWAVGHPMRTWTARSVCSPLLPDAGEKRSVSRRA